MGSLSRGYVRYSLRLLSGMFLWRNLFVVSVPALVFLKEKCFQEALDCDFFHPVLFKRNLFMLSLARRKAVTF